MHTHMKPETIMSALTDLTSLQTFLGLDPQRCPSLIPRIPLSMEPQFQSVCILNPRPIAAVKKEMKKKSPRVSTNLVHGLRNPIGEALKSSSSTRMRYKAAKEVHTIRYSMSDVRPQACPAFSVSSCNDAARAREERTNARTITRSINGTMGLTRICRFFMI
jgi:hypothetical protein